MSLTVTKRHPTPQLLDAKALLSNALADGPAPIAALEALAKRQGIGMSTMRRAAKQLGVRPKGSQFERTWALPNHAPGEPAEDRNAGRCDALITWMKEFLADGPRPASEVIALAKSIGYSQYDVLAALDASDIARRFAYQNGEVRWVYATTPADGCFAASASPMYQSASAWLGLHTETTPVPVRRLLEDVRLLGISVDELLAAVEEVGLELVVSPREYGPGSELCARRRVPNSEVDLLRLYDRLGAMVRAELGEEADTRWWLDLEVAIGAVMLDLFKAAGALEPPELLAWDEQRQGVPARAAA